MSPFSSNGHMSMHSTVISYIYIRIFRMRCFIILTLMSSRILSNACLMDFRFRNLIGSHEFVLKMLPSQATIFLLSNQDDVTGGFCYTRIASHQPLSIVNVADLALRSSSSDGWKSQAKPTSSIIIIIY